MTAGIVSARQRDINSGPYDDFIQTDASINRGNSGGPMFNLAGEVIGINTAIASNSGGNDGIGFTIPMDSVMFITTQLIDHGTVSRSFLGVVLDSFYDSQVAVDMGLTIARGTRVKELTPNSPAEKAGLKTGDIIIQFNGIEIEDDTHLVNIVKLTPMHDNVPISIIRNGNRREFKVYLSSRASLNLKTDE